VSSGDTNSDANKRLGDEVFNPCLLQSDTTLEEDEVQSSVVKIRGNDRAERNGALIRGEDGAQRSIVLFGEEDSAQGSSVQIRPRDRAHIYGVKIGHQHKVQHVGAHKEKKKIEVKKKVKSTILYPED